MPPVLKKISLLGLSLMLALLGGCAGKTMVESDLQIKGAPDWVNEGTNILNNKEGRLFHGVGSAAPMGDDSLQRATADDRARAEVARILSSYLTVVSRDYAASAQSGGEAMNEQSVSRSIENLTRINLTGARIIGRWKDKRSGTVYSIAELDMDHLKKTVSQVELMNPGFGKFIEQQGETIFDRMSKGE